MFKHVLITNGLHHIIYSPEQYWHALTAFGSIFKTLPLFQNLFRQSVVVPVVAVLQCKLTLKCFMALGAQEGRHDVFWKPGDLMAASASRRIN